MCCDAGFVVCGVPTGFGWVIRLELADQGLAEEGIVAL